MSAPSSPAAPETPVTPPTSANPIAQPQTESNPPETPKTPPPVAPTPGLVQFTAEEAQRLREAATRLQEIEAQRAADAAAAEQAKQDAAVAKGQAADVIAQIRKEKEEAIRTANDKLAAVQKLVATEKLTSTVDAGLVGLIFTGATPQGQAITANLVRSMIRDRLESVTDAAGVVQVREKITGRSASEVITEAIAEIPHLIAAKPSTGSGANPHAGSQPTGGAQPKTATELHVEQWKANQKANQSLGLHVLGTRP